MPFSCCSYIYCVYNTGTAFRGEPTCKIQMTLWPSSHDAERSFAPSATCVQIHTLGLGLRALTCSIQCCPMASLSSSRAPGRQDEPAGSPGPPGRESRCGERSVSPALSKPTAEQLLLLLPSTSIFLSLPHNLSSFQEISVCIRQGNGTCSYCWTLVQKLLLVWLCSSADNPPPRATARACRTHSPAPPLPI